MNIFKIVNSSKMKPLTCAKLNVFLIVSSLYNNGCM